MTHNWQNGAPANTNRKIRVKKDNKTILLRETANQKREIGRLGLSCYISGRSPDKSGDLADLLSLLKQMQLISVGYPQLCDYRNMRLCRGVDV